MIVFALLAASGAAFFTYKSVAGDPPEGVLVAEDISSNAGAPSDERPAYRATSSVSDVRIAATSVLPKNPVTAPVDDYCTGFLVDPQTTAGSYVQRQGWHVTSEAKIGSLHAISFAGSFEPGTSGACFATDPNVGFFAGDALQAIAYGDSIGTVEQQGSDRGRIWSNDIRYASAVADIHQNAKLLTITPLSATDAVCSGRAKVPNVFNSPIKAARRALVNAGWAPVPQSDEPDFRAAGLRRNGIVEAESCSGTGYGLCTFIYEDAAGRTLSITTAGDDPEVLQYGVDCAGR